MGKIKTKNQVISIKTDQENPEPVELIAKAIIDISKSFEKINKSSLTNRAIVLLLHDILKSKGVGIKEIELVLQYAPKLKHYFIK